MGIEIEYIKSTELSEVQRSALSRLDKECFWDVPETAINEDFIADPVAYIFAKNDGVIIARLAVFKRKIVFDNRDIVLGGMGGVCVTENMRHIGIASMMLKQGLEILKSEKCDIACLNVDLDKKIYSVYEKLGFVLMPREISFENVNGEIVKELGTMFIPVCSSEIYDLVMSSSTTFHYGKGYW